MIRSYKKFQDVHIQALDGEIGKIKDVYFDESSWRIQYFVIELGPWIFGRDVLIPPEVIAPFDENSIRVELTKAELNSSPHADEAIPVSLLKRYQQRSLFNLFYSMGGFLNGGPLIVPPLSSKISNSFETDPHLKSCRSVSNNGLNAQNECIGKIEDMLIDDLFWTIRFFVARVNTVDGFQEKLFESEMIENIETSLPFVNLGVSRTQALLKPDFNATRHLNTSLEVVMRELH